MDLSSEDAEETGGESTASSEGGLNVVKTRNKIINWDVLHAPKDDEHGADAEKS